MHGFVPADRRGLSAGKPAAAPWEQQIPHAGQSTTGFGMTRSAAHFYSTLKPNRNRCNPLKTNDRRHFYSTEDRGGSQATFCDETRAQQAAPYQDDNLRQGVNYIRRHGDARRVVSAVCWCVDSKGAGGTPALREEAWKPKPHSRRKRAPELNPTAWARSKCPTTGTTARRRRGR